MNQKGFYSQNVLAVSDSNLVFTSVVAKYPGSLNDAFICNNCGLKHRFQNGEFGRGWLNGASGFALTKYLLTPVNDPVDPGEERDNVAHKRSCLVIERAFGLLKLQKIQMS